MNQLWTVWGEKLQKNPEEIPLAEYPRPSFVRKSWMCLNGSWDYAFSDGTSGKIRVPFSPECALSGAGRQLLPGETLWYRRTFDFPERQKPEKEVLLHFGAVDQTAEVWINGKKAGEHTGGYLPFTLKIGRFLRKGENEIRVCVQDDSDTSFHARGKQKLQRGGMFYTATSGIWQTVWLEEVPERFMDGLELLPDPEEGCIGITVRADAAALVKIRLRKACRFETDYLRQPEDLAGLGQEILAEEEGRTNEEIRIRIPVEERHLWTQEEPWLYGLTVSMGEDEAESYAALRKFSVKKQENGPALLCLNGTPQFQRGVLDQGYWSDGLYTAPSDEAMIFDIAGMKKLGFSMLRKHMKIEPERWYYHCDRLGMAVWQDMVCGGGPIRSWFVTYTATLFQQFPRKISDAHPWLFSRTDHRGREEFERELLETIRLLRSHPCICSWVIFNEGWGQFETKRLTGEAKNADPEHLVDAASGWFDQDCGDFQSIHHYFFRLNFDRKDKRARILSEFGGIPYAVPDHTCMEKSYGYGRAGSREELQTKYDGMLHSAEEMQKDGFCGYVYTQLSDVEEEINGLYTFDRRVCKVRKGGKQ